MYKRKQEQLYIEKILSSKLITQEELLYIKQLYSEFVPYHNFLHALTVAESVLHLPTEKWNIMEIKSLFMAGLFHDAGHMGSVNTLDEFKSLDLAFQGISNFEKKYDLEGVDVSIVRKAIIGTVFKNRAKNTNRYAKVLADLDVSMVGKGLAEFLYYADFPFGIELGKDIHTWKSDVGFFKYLLSIDSHIFRDESIQKIYPHALQTIREYIQMDNAIYVELYEYFLSGDILFEEFEKKYMQYFS